MVNSKGSCSQEILKSWVEGKSTRKETMSDHLNYTQLELQGKLSAYEKPIDPIV